MYGYKYDKLGIFLYKTLDNGKTIDQFIQGESGYDLYDQLDNCDNADIVQCIIGDYFC